LRFDLLFRVYGFECLTVRGL